MFLNERYKGPEDLPADLPLFPLRGAILLPRTTLPLNVFEPRYVAMVEDAMRGARVLGIVQPAASEQDGESPADRRARLRRIGCAGRLTMYHEQNDGRLIVALTGIARFEIAAERETRTPYRVAEVSYRGFLSDFTPGTGEDRVDRSNLLRVLRLYLDANRLQADWDAIQRSSNEFLVNALSVMSPYGPEEKQALLEASDLKVRGDVLMALAEMELAAKGRPGGALQ